MRLSHLARSSIVWVLLACACGPAAAFRPSSEETTPSASAQSTRPANVSAAIAALDRAVSYRMELASREGRTMFRHDYLIVRNPESSWSLRVESSSGALQLIAIGDRGWIAEDGRAFERTTVSAVEQRAAGYDLRGILTSYADPALSSVLRFVVREQKNGVDADRYRADAAGLRPARPNVLANASLDVWIATAGYLTALDAVGVRNSDSDVRIDVRSVNDPRNRVLPPQ